MPKGHKWGMQYSFMSILRLEIFFILIYFCKIGLTKNFLVTFDNNKATRRITETPNLQLTYSNNIRYNIIALQLKRPPMSTNSAETYLHLKI